MSVAITLVVSLAPTHADQTTDIFNPTVEV